MLQRISLATFVFMSVCLLTSLISCENRQHAHETGTERRRTDRIAETSADVIMREDAEEVFYNLDVGKYADEGIKCRPAIGPDHGYLVGEDTRVGSVVYIKCHQGFWLSGPAVIACAVANGDASWTPSSERSCVQGKEFFNENAPIDPKDVVEELSPSRRNKETSLDMEGLPPFIPRNHRWFPSLLELHQRKMEDEEKEEKGFDRLRQELEDRLPAVCLSRPEVGSCSGTYRRFYFDKETMECKKFYYGGCGGNLNNFESIDDCMSICKGHSILGIFGRNH